MACVVAATAKHFLLHSVGSYAVSYAGEQIFTTLNTSKRHAPRSVDRCIRRLFWEAPEVGGTRKGHYSVC